MVEYLHDVPDVEPVIVDNNSSYPPLLEWYATRPCKIIRCSKNMGHLAPWKLGVATDHDAPYYGVTDPDLDLSSIPKDFSEVLIKGLEKFPNKIKVGFSIEVEGYPDNEFKEQYIDWQIGFWQTPLYEDMYWDSEIDTTFAYYRNEPYLHTTCALRTNRPYTVKHLPFHLDVNNLPEDFVYYCRHANEGVMGNAPGVPVSSMAHRLRKYLPKDDCEKEVTV